MSKQERTTPSQAQQSARQAFVTGPCPRIAPLDAAELTQEAVSLMAGMIVVNSSFEPRSPQAVDDLVSAHAAEALSPDTVATLSPLLRTMLRHPSLFARQVDVSAELMSKGALPPRDRELLVLRVAWLTQAPFEWGEHVHIAKTTGLSGEEIERITLGSSAPGWSEHDRALLSAVEELRADAMIGDSTWATLTASYDARQLIELIIVIGQYQTVAYYQNSLRVGLHEGNPGLKAR